jgi:hypothetical protein
MPRYPKEEAKQGVASRFENMFAPRLESLMVTQRKNTVYFSKNLLYFSKNLPYFSKNLPYFSKNLPYFSALSGIVWKSHKTLIFKVPLAASGQHTFTLIPLLKDCAVLHRVAVFFYRKGRRGFAEDAKASRPLQSLCARSPEAAGQALKTCNRTPFAKDAKPLRPLRSPCALCVTKTPQRGEETRNAVKKYATFFLTIPGRTTFLWL